MPTAAEAAAGMVVRDGLPAAAPSLRLLTRRLAPTAAAAAVVTVLAVVAAADQGGPYVLRSTVAALAVAWAAAAVVTATIVPEAGAQRLATLPSTLAVAALLAVVALVLGSGSRGAPLATALLAGASAHFLVALAGPMATRLVPLACGYGLSAVIGAAATVVAGAARPALVASWWAACLVAGVTGAHRRYRRAGPALRRRLHWVGWALSVAVEAALIVVALRLLAAWPPHPGAMIVASTVTLPVALAAASHRRLMGRADRLPTATVTAAGLTVLVIAAYGTVVLLMGRRLREGERPLLLLSMVAATVAAVVYPSVRGRLVNATNQVVYGERVAPDAALRTWGARLTRAIPMDELLLQLTESLRKSMALSSAEVFAGPDGVYELAAGVPHRQVEPLRVPEASRGVVARAGVSGGTWLDVWLPELVRAGSVVRVAPIAHAGQLLGLIVVARPEEWFSEEEDRVLAELARQVALALHNVQLDSALEASLVELQQANRDLRESRRRIVTAGDAERRRLERNLHDGAQQYLVAMAVKLRLAEDLVEEAPDEAVEAITELRRDLKDAIEELRALAHGIFPPLLTSGGLAEALPNAAGRAALPTTVDTLDVGRLDPEIEATVYFCCLEAMQNAGKHAGPGAEVAVRVERTSNRLTWTVTDDGVGFDPRSAEGQGHGFVNMADRLGTVGGRLTVVSSPGAGTTIRGEIPLTAIPPTG